MDYTLSFIWIGNPLKHTWYTVQRTFELQKQALLSISAYESETFC